MSITAKEELDHRLSNLTEERAEYLLALIDECEEMLSHAEIDEGDPSWACGLDEKSASRLLELQAKAKARQSIINADFQIDKCHDKIIQLKQISPQTTEIRAEIDLLKATIQNIEDMKGNLLATL